MVMKKHFGNFTRLVCVILATGCCGGVSAVYAAGNGRDRSFDSGWRFLRADASGSFTLYEDEGNNYNYETGSYTTIPFTWNDVTHTLAIGAREGSFPGMLVNRTFHDVWVSAGHGCGIALTPTTDAVVSYSGNSIQVYGGN